MGTKYINHSRFSSYNTIGRAYVNTTEENPHFDLYNFYISTQTLELEMTVCAIHRSCWLKETISDLIQWLK